MIYICNIYMSIGYDRWDRPVVVLDNTVENTSNIDDQMLFLAWNLELAIRDMPPHVDKFLVFVVSTFI
jgi:hypothetical protein